MDTKIFIADLADGLSKRNSISKKDAENFVRTVFDTIQEQLLAGESVKIKGLGTFKVITVESRESINVGTGERFVIDSHNKISFTPEKSLADHVNKPFAGFETVMLNENTKTEDMERIDNVEPEAEEEKPVAEEPVVEVAAAESVPVKEETPVVEEPVAEKTVAEPIAPVMSKEEPKPVVEEAKPVVEEVKAPETKAVEPEKPKSKWWLWLIIALLLIAGIVWFVNSRNSVPAEPVQEVIPDTTEVVPEPVKSAEELAADFDQIVDGEYWIVGTKTTHVLERGEDLSKLAEQYYGDKKLINYIIRHNDFTVQKASNLFVGAEVKIPELVKRD